MSEQENLQIVQRIYKAFAEGDLPAMLNLMGDDVEMQDYFSAKVLTRAGSRSGRHAVEEFFRMVAESIEFQVFQPVEFIVARDSVVVLGHERCRVRATGRVVEANWAQVWTLHDGMIRRFREYSDTAAWEAGFSGT